MKKSVSEQLLTYLQTNGGVHASGNLQRLEWRNRDGTLAVPRTVVRRLQELAAEGKIHIQYTGNHASYSADPIIPPQHKPNTIYVEINGQLVNVKDL